MDAGRKIYQRGLVAANDGNLSVRVGDNACGLSPTSVSKGAMTEDMLVKLSLDGTVLEGTRKPSSETKMHLLHLPRTPAVRAVVHAHPPAGHRIRRGGPSPGPPCPPGGCGAAGHRACGPLCPARFPGGGGQRRPPTARRTGPCCWNTTAPVTWGTSMEQAHYRLECLEQLATVTLHLRTLGIHRTMPGVSG